MMRPDVHYYLSSYYFSYWAYFGPAFYFACSIFFGIYYLSPALKLQEVTIFERYAWYTLFIYMSIVCLGLLMLSFYKATHLRKSKFKTEPFITLTAQGILLHENDAFFPWQDIKSIRHVTSKSTDTIYLDLHNKESIRIDKNFTISKPEMEKTMTEYHEAVICKPEQPPLFAQLKQKFKDFYKKLRSR